MKDVDHGAVMERAQRVVAHANDVMARLDQRGGPVQQAAQRERRRVNSSLGRTIVGATIAVALIWLAAIIVGLIQPIGMFGFLAVILLSATVGAMILAGGRRTVSSTPAPSPDLPNGEMVERFDSYMYKVRGALPAPAQAQVDAISTVLPPLKETLARVDTLDPQAQDARRLMSVHLPGLIDRYRNVPAAYRSQPDGEGKTVDERLVESLAAARTALCDVSEQLARQDLAAFETQGRFIKSRYGEEPIDS